MKVLLDTIKNLQTEVSRIKSTTLPNTKSSFVQNIEKGRGGVEAQKLKRQFDYLAKENDRLKSLNQNMKELSRDDFSKIMKMNTFYKMLNGELQGYVEELKDELGKLKWRKILEIRYHI